jgi:hypothetical protein
LHRKGSQRYFETGYVNYFSESRFGSWFWSYYPRVVVKTFRYVADPLFLAGCTLYALNRWVIKSHVHLPFFHGWFNDVLLIPCALPPLLLMQRWLGLRTHDRSPTLGEIAAHLIGWSILFEWIGPHLMRHTTGDPWDVVAYTAGAIIAFLWWHRRNFRSHVQTTQGF